MEHTNGFDQPIDHQFADTIVRYVRKGDRIALELIPADMRSAVLPHRSGLAGLPFIDSLPFASNPPAAVVDSLVQIKVVGDAAGGGFVQGHSMRGSATTAALRFAGQTTTGGCPGAGAGAATEQSIITTLVDAPTAAGSTADARLRVEHRLTPRGGAFEVVTSVANQSAQPLTVEMLSSFVLGGITPFDAADAPNRLKVHRFRSAWSAEGRLDTCSLEQLHLERSWLGVAALSERFGQVGTMPVRRWFPFVAVEDKVAGVVWGAQTAWAGSWQMEIFRQHDDVSLSGGLADREFGHWQKTLAPGETLTSPSAYIACVHGDLDDLCDRFTALQHAAADQQPAVEADLPIVFNEWCTSWGDPSHQRMVAIAERLRDSATKYLVIDAGWYKREGTSWSGVHGDWIPNTSLFPDGLAATVAAIRERGLIPGLWFEMETVGPQATACSMIDQLLQRDGRPLISGARRFWDLNNPATIEYLSERVIGLLERCNFGYLKVDYNETIGIGCDHPDGLGEGLRRQVLATYRFFELIRARLPQLVIENCASGGHRIEPSMIARSAMSSFSDAHELPEIPIIAANLQRMILPRQSQVWAVLRATDSDQRLAYSLAATFLGRMCLSGEITELSPAQWQLVTAAQTLYRRIVPIIKHGVSRRYDSLGASLRYPTGRQVVVRRSADGTQILVVVHTFAGAGAVAGGAPGGLAAGGPAAGAGAAAGAGVAVGVGDAASTVALPVGDWQIAGEFPQRRSVCQGDRLILPPLGDFSATVVHLVRAT